MGWEYDKKGRPLPPMCDDCGKFVPYSDIESKEAFYESERRLDQTYNCYDVSVVICKKCMGKHKQKEQNDAMPAL